MKNYNHLILLWVLAASLLTAVPLYEVRAATGEHMIAEERIDQLAEKLVTLIGDEELTGSCRLHLAEIETVSGSFLATGSFQALEAAISRALSAKSSNTDCVVESSKEPAGTEAKGVMARLSDEGRPSFVYTMSFFPRQDQGLMLLATAYRPNGRFVAFSGPLVIDTVITETDRQPSANGTITTAPVTPEAPKDYSGLQPEPDAETSAALGAKPPSAMDKSIATELDQSSVIGTPAEIEAIIAMKRSVMPKTAKPVDQPGIGLRIDTGGTAGSAMMKELAQAFLLDQAGASPSTATIEDQGNLIQLSGQPAAKLQNIEIVDSNPSSAFEKLFRGDVDLVLSSEPISQADYDRFAEAFGVDMRSGAGETVIGVVAGGLIVHPSNRLPSLTKEVAAEIFDNKVANWGQATVSQSGLTGPIQTLALEEKGALYDGYAVRPDLVFKANAEIGYLVAINPLSIGYSSIVKQGNYRHLGIEECGIVYSSDDFFMRTEDHPLAKRLFLYSNPGKGNRYRNAFLFFATSEKGQDLIAERLVNLEAKLGDREATQRRIDVIRKQPITDQKARARLINAIEGSRRLSTTFRFRFDSDELRLDQSAARDLANLIRLSRDENLASDRLMILGFADSDGDLGYNEKLSLERAKAIAKRLVTYGVPVPPENVIGFGEDAPVACNERPEGTEDDLGKSRNRRVEVWLRDAAF